MSSRSPTADGLALSPNAPGNINNPAASPQELQVHHYWGRYANETDLPNNGTNAANVPAYSKLLPGDVGFVQATGCLYVCTDRGTLLGNDAVWTCMISTIVQTIRDAHVIVVANDGWLATLSGIGPPNAAANNLNLGAGVGDVVSVTCDYLDPGDGSELTRALAAAGAAGVPVDVRLRPMDLGLVPATTPLTVPNEVRLIGAGMNLSTITGAKGGDQTIFALGIRASIEDLHARSGAPVAAVSPGTAVVNMGSGAKVLRCRVTLEGNTGGVGVNRTITTAVGCVSPVGTELIDDCEFFVDSLDFQQTPDVSRAMRFGSAGAGIPDNDRDFEVRNTTIEGSTPAAGCCPQAIQVINVAGGRFFNVEHINAVQPRDAFSWGWGFALGVAAPFVRGPKFIECRMTATDAENPGTNQSAFLLSVGGAPNIGDVIESVFEDCSAFFLPAGNPANIERTGFRIANAANGTNINFTTFVACKSLASRKGFVIDASGGTNGRITSTKMVNCFAPSQTTGAGIVPYGLRVRGNATSPGETVRTVGVHNCDFTDQVATGFGIGIDDVGVVNTIILGNSLTPAGGTALLDVGTGTEAAHNIL